MNIFIAIIPGPHDPHYGHEMHAALQPLVEELKVLDQSAEIGGLKVRVRAVLCSCDLPAMLGMLSHNANKGKAK